MSDLSPLSGLTGLTSLDVRGTSVADLSVLLELPRFASETAEALTIDGTSAADPKRDPRLSGLSNLPPQECALEVVRYLKGQETPSDTAPKPPLPERLAKASPVQLVVQEGRLAAVNAGAPERDKPDERTIRLRALRTHLAQLQEEATTRQVPRTIQSRLAAYAEPLADEEPTYLLLDGPMAFIRGGLSDPYLTEALDAGFLSGWRHLCHLHDGLRPLLLPPEEPDQPQPAPDATPEEAIKVADGVIEVLEPVESVDRSVIAALEAAKEYFVAAKQEGARGRGAFGRGLVVLGYIVNTAIQATAGAAAGIWLATPSGQAALQHLRPIWEVISRMFLG